MKLLVVDDSKAARMLIKSLIYDFDQSIVIHEAANGKEATEIHKKEDPDITFLDLTMPVMDGFEALKIIRNNDKEAIVVVLTADLQKKSIDKCMSLGAYEVIKKLPQKESISKILHEILNR